MRFRRSWLVVVVGAALVAAVVLFRARRARPRPPHPLAQLRFQEGAQPRHEPPALSNLAAYLPAQCYAETRDAAGKTHNGCFTCHQQPRPPTYTDDSAVQTQLTLPRYATENRWSNLSTPPPPVALPDAEVLAWVRQSNYRGADGEPVLARTLATVPPAWDGDGDGRWSGYVPDGQFRVDAQGFDRDATGKATGWRAYAYAPVAGMFWPTNGSAGDAFIRLPAAYRQDAQGRERRDLYLLNLAIVEAYIRRIDVPIDPTDERALGSDLDGDGKLGEARVVRFVWPPVAGRPFHYLGKAAELDEQRWGWPAAGLYPVGTEFLHSVRYLDVVDGQVRMAERMKELRYMRKVRWRTYSDLDQQAEAEAREKLKSPDKLKLILANVERGVGTGAGWLMQGFIEDARGALRPQSVEETTACVGCHGGVGATTDGTFSFPRKASDGTTAGGWYHWGERGFAGIPEPRRADGTGEYAHYLAQVGGGDDYRSNDEVQRRFFWADGALRPELLRRLSRDISVLLVPSAERALALDRAYLALVRAQRFERGRDVLVGPGHVQERLVQDGPTGIAEPVAPAWKSADRTAAR